MRLCQLRLSNIVMRRAVTLEWSECHVLERSRSIGGVGNRSPYCFLETSIYAELFYILYFISLSIFLARTKATEVLYVGQAITPTCFRDAKILRSDKKIFFWFFSFMKIWMKFRTACQDHQTGKSAVNVSFSRTQQNAQVGFEPRLCQSQSQRSNELLLIDN